MVILHLEEVNNYAGINHYRVGGHCCLRDRLQSIFHRGIAAIEPPLRIGLRILSRSVLRNGGRVM